jgi:hypothetical protein
MPRQIKYVDFGIDNASAFFRLITLPNVEAFEAAPSIQSGLNAVWGLWHLHEWYWHDTHPKEDPRRNAAYDTFLDNLYQACPELKYLRDLSEAAKHCGMGRTPLPVGRLSEQIGRHGVGGYGEGMGYNVAGAYAFGTPQLRVFFDDGSDPCWLDNIITAAKDFWSRVFSEFP